MLEAFAEALRLEGLWFVATGALIAGIVRGFAGFGTAMIYLPVAGQVLGPFEAITTLIVMDIIAPMIHVPRALKDGHPSDVLRLTVGALIAMPIGVFVLSLVAPEVFRWSVSLVALGLLVLLVTGIRYRGALTKPIVYATGGAGGFFAGAVGMPGPPVILMYMVSTLPPSAIRANNTLYLITADILLVALFYWNERLVFTAVVIGLLVMLPYLVGNWLGAKLFRPEAAHLYRRIAYVIIAASAIMGLPIWD